MEKKPTSVSSKKGDEPPTQQEKGPFVAKYGLGLLPCGIDDNECLHLGYIYFFDGFSVLEKREEEDMRQVEHLWTEARGNERTLEG